MICETCFCMLRGQVGRRLMGSFDLRFDHQKSDGTLRQAADSGCSICRVISDDLTRSQTQPVGSYMSRRRNSVLLSAFLSELKVPDLGRSHELYMLYFRLAGGKGSRLSSFVLETIPADASAQRYRYTPTEPTLESTEVLDLAKYWLRKCNEEHHGCKVDLSTLPDRTARGQTVVRQDSVLGAQNSTFYPTRLIELKKRGATQERAYDVGSGQPLKRHNSDFLEMDNETPETVGLVITKSAQPKPGEHFHEPQGRYMTLSHCWGKGSNFFCLQESNLDRFVKDGIPLNELPITFREAIKFARQLAPDDVKYIWIDSLCIVQDSEDNKDWQHEAAQMFQVYRNSYLNISATAAQRGEDGLYAYRDPRNLWESEVYVNAESVAPGGLTMRRKKEQGILGAKVRRCSVVNPVFWESKVDDAPVNRRGWVLQERLLAPRVIHFCNDQIAWECHTLDAAECAPEGISDLEYKSGAIRARVRLKDQSTSGLKNKPLAHENWKRIVERYSRTSLTKPGDKLIALAGIAELMSSQISSPYYAGIWKTHFASQLLWRVATVFKHERFQYPSCRPKEYRAPSFSWAAIDAPQGIICAETREEESMLIKVLDIKVDPKTENRFGQVKENAYLKLSCQMIRVQIHKKPRIMQDDSIFTWVADERWIPRDLKIRPIVYLDSPLDDWAGLQDSGAAVFLVPAYKNAQDYVVCLLLKQIYLSEGYGNREALYQRIGTSEIPPYVLKSDLDFLDENGRIQMPRHIMDDIKII